MQKKSTRYHPPWVARTKWVRFIGC